jgi:hypothetical protein
LRPVAWKIRKRKWARARVEKGKDKGKSQEKGTDQEKENGKDKSRNEHLCPRTA